MKINSTTQLIFHNRQDGNCHNITYNTCCRVTKENLTTTAFFFFFSDICAGLSPDVLCLEL